MKKEDIRRLVEVYDEYVRLFANEENYKKGEQIRAEIAELKKRLAL